MGRKNKKVIARILAVLMAFTLLPFDLWGSANVVIADEPLEAYTEEAPEPEEDTAAAEDAADDAQEDVKSAESTADEQDETTDVQNETTDDANSEDVTDVEEEEETSASESDVKASEEVKIEEDTKEEEKVSTERQEDLKANTEGYVLSKTTEWTFNTDFFTERGVATGKALSGNVFGDSDGNGYLVISSGTVKANASNFLSMGATAKIGLPVAGDTDAIEITVTMQGVTGGRILAIGEGEKKENIYHKSSDGSPSFDSNRTYTNEKLYLKTDSIFSNVLLLEAASGENKIASIVLKEYKTSGPQKEKAATPTANLSDGTALSDGSEVKAGSTIKLSCTTSNVTIYYTTDESDPKTSGTKQTYTNGIEVTPAMVNGENKIVLKAYATGDDNAPSDIMTHTYTALKGDNQLDPPTADPDDTKAVVRGTEITLKSNDPSASVYYTFDESVQLTKENGTLFENDKPIVINKDTTIQAIAVADGKTDSSPVVFTYTIKTPTIAVADNAKDLISSVEMKGDVIFKNQSDEEVFDIKLSAEKKTSVSTAITKKAESIKKDGGEILYYDLTLINEESQSDIVSISEGALKIKMPYSIAASKTGRKNEITILNGTNEVTEVRKDVDGILFSADSVTDPYTIIINPVPVNEDEDDETAPKTYIFDPEEYEITGDLTADAIYGTDDYYTVVCTSDKKAAIVEIDSVTTGSGASKVNSYENLTWSDEVMEVIGGGRTKCLRITGGKLSDKVGDTPLNCVKITTTTTNASVVVYYSPKSTNASMIRVAKDDAGKIGSLQKYGNAVTCENIGTAKFSLDDAGTYYIGLEKDGGIITYMEVTETPEVPVIDMPTADPVSGTQLNRKSEIILKTDVEGADIYYTTNGDDPVKKEDAVNKKYTAPIAVADLTATDNKITIKAIAVTKSGKSEVAVFEYDYDPNAVATVIDEDSKAIIKAVEAVGNVSEVTRGGQSVQVTDITVKAQEIEAAAVDSDIKTAAEALVTDADKSNIKYYNISLILNDEADVSADTVTFKENTGLNIKMLYSNFRTDALGDVTEENEIFVLHNAEQIAEEKIKTETVTTQNAEDVGVWFEADSFSPYTVVVNPAVPRDLGTVKTSKFAGYEEGAYAEWEAYEGADGYKAYIASKEDGDYVRIDNALIREYKDHWRVDTVGLKAGSSYYLKIEAVKVKTEGDDENVEVLAEKAVGPMTVTNYDRSGFAFSSESPFKSGSGAYKDNGELKNGAQVIYVTKDTAKTCKAMIHTAGANKPAVEVTGLQSILDAKQKKGTENDIIDIRIIGRVTKDDLDHISSKAEGLQVKGAAKYNEMNITIEGIGEDAVVHGFGFLIRNCGNVELRNFAIMAFMDDGVSLDTANCNIWVHDLDIFYGSTGGDSDQAKGDGSVDVKGKSTYITVSYNHFWDSGKCSLCGMSDSEEFMVTYHHNWFDHSDSRHPRIRVGSIHVYNNYFDGNSKYGVGVTKGSSAFVEANYFRNCKYPMLISQQASDLSGDGTGTFSGEPGGMIKAYANKIEGAQRLVYANKANGSMAANAKEFDAYLAESRDEKVPSSYVTVKGGTSYNNFDTGYDLGVKASAVDSADNVKDIVTAKAGRLNGGDFKRKSSYSISNDDQSYAVDTVLKADVVNYQSSIIYIGGIKGASGSSGGGGTGSGGSGDSGDDNPGGDTPGGNTPGISGGGIYVHNFTTDGFSSDKFFTINGNKQSKPATVSYVDPNGNALTLTQALKMESSSKISFNAGVSGTLIIVLVPESGKTGKTKVDGVSQDPADGIIEVYFDTAGAHTIEKGDKADIYYVAYVEDTYDTNDVLEPVLSIPSGNLPMGTPLTMTCATEGAEIYYTTDKSSPTAKSSKYTAPVVLEGAEGEQVTVKAIAIKGDKESIVVTCTYTFVDPDKYVAEPVASKEDGAIEKGTAIELSTLTEDAQIYYTYKTDGTQPADPDKENGSLYTGPIIISRTTTIKAIAIKGDLKSEISTFQYTVSSGSSGSETTGAKTFEFNPQKIGFSLDETETDKNGTEKKLHKLPAEDTGYGTDNYFTIGNKDDKARITENTLSMPEGNKSGITEYTIRYQFGGSAKTPTDPKAIRFTTYGKATVYVGAYGSDETRKLLLDSQSQDLTKVPTEYTFSVEKGEHAIYAEKDYYILYIIVEDTDVPGAGEPSGGEETGVSKPVADPPSGTYSKGTEISLGAELGAKIYYTTDKSEPTTGSTLYTTEIVLEEDLTIKAIAELDGKVSESAAFEYKVKQEDIPPAENKVSEPKANYPTGTKLEKGTKIELTCDTEGAQIYYTLDKTAPSDQKTRILYENPIEIAADTTIKAIAVKDGYTDSEIITFEYTVIENTDEPAIPEGSGLRVVLKNKETYTYTGSAIKPEILVYNNNDRLVEGTDYIVQYKNNINASANARSDKQPQIIVRAKRNLSGSVSAAFEIEKKDISDSMKGAGAVEVSGVTSDGELLVVENTKASPALYYGGAKLASKSFSVSKTDKCKLSDDGSEIVISGKGNFEGELKYKMKVISKKSLKKFQVSFKNPNYVYNGEPQVFEPAEGDVKDISKTDTNGASLKKGIDYTIVYQKDVTNAGKVKFTVVGLGYYTGAVEKYYTIKPRAVTYGMRITGVSNEPYPYVSTGVTIDDARIFYNDILLEEGKDYRMVYSGNKKLGTAKLTVMFDGNYRGSSKISEFFTIGPSALTDSTSGLKVAAADMVYTKPGTYKSVPYVSVNDVQIKMSNFIVKYYTDEALEKEVNSKNKIVLSDQEPYKTVYIKITGKNKGNYQGTELTASYKVCRKDLERVYDLSKARLIVYDDWSNLALKTNKLEYTGGCIEPGVSIEFKQGKRKIVLEPEKVKQLIDSGELTIQYVNNRNKGKAVIIVNGDGVNYAGSKKAVFSITAKNIKNTGLLDDLFTSAVEKCNVRYLLQNP